MGPTSFFLFFLTCLHLKYVPWCTQLTYNSAGTKNHATQKVACTSAQQALPVVYSTPPPHSCGATPPLLISVHGVVFNYAQEQLYFALSTDSLSLICDHNDPAYINYIQSERNKAVWTESNKFRSTVLPHTNHTPLYSLTVIKLKKIVCD